MPDDSVITTPVKAGAAGVVGAGLVAVSYQFRHDNTVLLLLAAGVVFVLLLLAGYRTLLKVRQSRASKLFGDDLKAGSGRKPREINSPNAIAKVADLRQTFEEGVEKFRAAGKSLYSLPWYMLVGETGSGKSEAIRRCKIDFPSGLQDPLQGIGGTVNMNWWFTNFAVILDTAGRMLFDNIEAGSTPEWPEFLKLLLRARPNCPVNGLILAIPVDSLIVDTPETIESKAGKIAAQLDTIKRTLGVRFPVFVVITKADRINGFREFFDGLDDPKLQHQMLGWSNPDPLDTPFDPELIEQHMADVRQRLDRRRLGLMLDPVNTDDPDGRRLDQVDALYAFPESLAAVGPGLRLYMDRLFAASEWAPKTDKLFLRGIYFTSSLREGAALDLQVAEMLGVPVESLPGGQIFDRERSFFLRDLFMTKMFREKGLVTRAGNTRRVQTGRKLAVLGTGLAAMAVLSGMTVFSAISLRKAVGSQAEYWAHLKASQDISPDGRTTCLTIIKRDETGGYHYYGNEPVRKDGDARPVTDYLVRRDGETSPVAKIDRPIAFFWEQPSALENERTKAYRRVFEESVIEPVVSAVRQKLSAEPDGKSLSDEKSDLVGSAVRQLSVIENAVGPDPKRQTPDLQPLFKYLFSDPKDAGQYKLYMADQDGLDKNCQWLFPAGPVADWQYVVLNAGSEETKRAIDRGADLLNHYWQTELAVLPDKNSPRFALRLWSEVNDFKIADDKLRKFDETGWIANVPALIKAREGIDASLQTITGGVNPHLSLAELYKSDKVDAADRVKLQIAASGLTPTKATADALAAAKPAGGTAVVPKELYDLEGYFNFPDATPSKRVYADISDGYAAARDQISSGASSNEPGEPVAKVIFVGKAVTETQTSQDLRLPGVPEADADSIKLALGKLLAEKQTQKRIEDAIAGLNGKSVKEVESSVAACVADQKLPQRTLPRVFVTGPGELTTAPAFDPSIAEQFLYAWSAIRARSKSPECVRDTELVTAYTVEYVSYWNAALIGNDVPGATQSGVPAWTQVQAELAVMKTDPLVGLKQRCDQYMTQSATVGGPMSADYPDYTALYEKASRVTAGTPATGPLLNWTTLPANPSEAGKVLYDAGPRAADVAPKFVPASEGNSLADQYLWHVTHTSADSLAAAQAGGMVSGMKQQFIKSYRTFPLAPPTEDGKILSPDELAAARLLLADIEGKSSDIGVCKDAAFLKAYTRIVGNGFNDGLQREQRAEFAWMAAVIKNEDELLHLRTADRGTQTALENETSLESSEEKLDIFRSGGGLTAATSLIQNTSASPVPGKEEAVSWKTSDKSDIEFRFKTIDGTDDGKKILQGPWPLMRAVYKADRLARSKGKANGRETDDLLLPIVNPGPSGNRDRRIVIRVEFAVPLPDRPAFTR